MMKSHFVLESFVSGNKSIFEVASYTLFYLQSMTMSIMRTLSTEENEAFCIKNFYN